MKKISITLTDVDVQLIKFVAQDAYEDFDFLENRTTENVASEVDEISKLQAKVPIALCKQRDGSYILITQKQLDTVLGHDGSAL
ncbi:MAG TPA: hypothetical protein VK658_15555 [Chryseolinea sp.]|nr:hypothetical protein [Chryseolinea sp.]